MATFKKQLSETIRSRIEVRTIPSIPNPLPVLSSMYKKNPSWIKSHKIIKERK
jgi:hypothetical protein